MQTQLLSDTKEQRALLPGLSAEEAAHAREKYGRNILPAAKRKSFLSCFIKNLGDPVIKILLGALLINLIFLSRTSDVWETVGIAVSVLSATLISTLSERGSEKAYARLERESAEGVCRVRRREGVLELPFSEVSVGDIVLLSAGDEIPADGFIVRGALGLDMSSMTGESREVKKLPGGGREMLPSSPSSLLRGARAVSGEGEMLVSAVGGATLLGSISREVQADVRESPLKVRLTKLARQISLLGYLGAALVALAYLFNALVIDSSFSAELILQKLTNPAFIFPRAMEAFTLGLSVVVVAVPEGLPMMIAVVLSANVRRMVRGGVLVKKPVGIEAAGSMDLLFTDKTGTLTEGRMRVCSIITPDGGIARDYRELARKEPEIARIYRLSALFNTAAVIGKSDDGSAPRALGGNATDRALLDSIDPARRAEISEDGFFVAERIAFDSSKKYSAAHVCARGEGYWLYKGAPDLLLRHASGYKKRVLARALAESCKDGERGILIAVSKAGAAGDGLPDDLEPVCAVLLRDPVRKNARDSVIRLRRAGIGVVMVTGDSTETAESIARECGLIDSSRYAVRDSHALAAMSDEELCELLPHLAVVARALPGDKSRLVRVAQSAGRVTGMTGDGINDAPALRAADVGFAMGSGNAVARDAGDVVILSDDLGGIANAVLYGRNIFKSIRKFICLQLTVNFSAVGVSMAGPFLGIDSPITVVQMLWLNVIMDTLGGLAFAGEAAQERIMRERPKRRDEEILSPYMKSRIAFLSVYGLAAALRFLLSDSVASHFAESAGDARLLSGFFAFFVFLGLFDCLSARCDRLNPFSGLTKNPLFVLIILSVGALQLFFTYVGGSVLRTVPLSAHELGYSFLCALSVLPAGMIHTLWRRIRGKKDGY